MAKILVVDDSSVDRRLVGALLDKVEEYDVSYATSGQQALAQIELDAPDLVLTDLFMPEIDGLELVAIVKGRFRLIPIVLMTSQGNEELAVAAMQRGAASYVPKNSLANELLSVVRRVLALSARQVEQARLMTCMKSNYCNFILENDRRLIAPLIAYLQACVTLTGVCDATDRVRVGVALEEALTNALLHGNLRIDLHDRNADAAEHLDAVIEERRNRSEFKDRRIFLDATLTPEEAKFVIRDQGEGFSLDDLPDPTDPANLEKPNGRGVQLMRLIMDEVRYNDAGNELTLIKRRVKEMTEITADGD